MLSIGVTAVRLCAVSMLFGAASVIISSASQSLGHAGLALFINLCRQALLMLPIAFLLSRFGRLELVWMAPALSEFLAFIAALIVCRYVIRGLKRQQAALA